LIKNKTNSKVRHLTREDYLNMLLNFMEKIES